MRWRGKHQSGLCGGLACLLSVGLLATSFSGCRTSWPPYKKPTTQRLTLQLATWGSATEIATLKPLLDAFEAKHPKIHVSLLHVPEYYYPKLHLLMAAKLAPDVMLMGSDMMPVYAEAGQLRNLAADISQQAREPFYPNVMAAFSWPRKPPEKASKQISASGGLYALPRDVSALAIFVNVDWFERAGVARPDEHTTWQDVLTFSPKLLKAAHTTPAYAISFNRTPPLYWLPFVWSWGGGGLASMNTASDLLEDPNACRGLQFYVDLVHKFHLAPSRQAAGNTPMTDRFLAGQLAMMINGHWAVPVLREKARFRWTITPFPQGPHGSRVGVDSAGYAVSAHTRHPKEALALARFLTSPEAMAAFSESGLIMPARKRLKRVNNAEGKHDTPSAIDKPFIEALETGMATQSGARWHRLSDALNQELEPVWESGVVACQRGK
ncbi:MAG: sugar ABC transporter substrate-binding protein [Vampirovibrionales bacterium]|nr:sugar ABC transporter substrate-binding protein [Vampirovibrionales bacterium]